MPREGGASSTPRPVRSIADFPAYWVARSSPTICTHLLVIGQHRQKTRVFSTIADQASARRFRERGSSKSLYSSRFSRCVNLIGSSPGVTGEKTADTQKKSPAFGRDLPSL